MFSPDGMVNERDVVVGTRALEHRGPDGEGFYFDLNRRVGLGHRRLAIIEPLNGHQPIANESGTIHAVVNGEFYDHERQRLELESRGHQFQTDSDSELLVHLYEDHGIRCLRYLQGEFAFVLWDEKQQHLFAARDRFGVKPLVYSQGARGLTIASEAKAIFATGGSANWDVESFFFAANLQYLPPDRTYFNNIASLPAACYLIANCSSLRVHPYWQINDDTGPVGERNCQLDARELVEQCRQHLVSAVTCRLRSDVPICTHLSGGLDSNAVTGIAASTMHSPIDAFCLSFDHAQYDERHIASASAAYFGARLHCVHVSADDVLHTLSDAVIASEGLAINGHLSAKHLLHQAMRQQGFAVTLTGEGADEAFYGYAHLRMDGCNPVANIDAANRDAAFVHLNQTSVGMMLPHGDSLDLTGIERRLKFVPTWMRAKATLGWKIQSLLHPDALRSFAARDAFLDVARQVLSREEALSSALGRPPVETSRKLWTRLALSGYILRTLGDGTEMPHSIEGRVPFLDHRLWEFLRSVPLKRQFFGSIEKPLLRAAIRPFVTPMVHDRPKHPLDAPPVMLFARSTAENFLRDQIRSDAMRSQPFFCAKRVERILLQLNDACDIERQAWDPVFMLILSTLSLDRMLNGKQSAINTLPKPLENR